EFLLAEAVQRNEFSVGGTAEDHYKKAVAASLYRWGIDDGANGFDFNLFYNQPSVSLATADDKIERIMEQKWVSGWFGIEAWFDWRRTGYPAFRTGPVTEFAPPNSNALPLRFIYPLPNQDEKYLVNYNAAVERLEKTLYVPQAQSKDHHYSKMWLLQGTGRPY
ncbi:MAG: SusD/RagB family nutrient-binding outer membrane lipoprotein, partial [Tannerella sp.]|nr:SusD/RagB family nutrient-binding outer membrane lipoprotein [Tannerella sp.]